MSDQSHWTDKDRNTKPEGCHLCGSEDVPLTNYSRHYGGYQGPHWLCRFCENTQAASRLGAGNRCDDWQTVVGDVAAMLNEFTKRSDYE